MGFGEGPTSVIVSSKNKFDLIVISDDFVLDSVACELCFMSIICALTSFYDSALPLADQVRIFSHSNHHPYMFWLSICDHVGIHCFYY